jgi:hypothetical protein
VDGRREQHGTAIRAQCIGTECSLPRRHETVSRDCVDHGGNLLAVESRRRDIDHREACADQHHALTRKCARHAPRVGRIRGMLLDRGNLRQSRRLCVADSEHDVIGHERAAIVELDAQWGIATPASHRVHLGVPVLELQMSRRCTAGGAQALVQIVAIRCARQEILR